MSEFPRRYSTKDLQKPAKGSTKMARITTARARELAEEKNKAAAKKRDGYRCQRPNCPNCREYGKRQGDVQGAHWKAKGMGGDKQNIRSQRKHFITLCPLSHAAQEGHDLVIVPRDIETLMDGPRDFFFKGQYEGVSFPEGTR